MAYNVWQRSIVDEAGNIVPSADVEVRDQVTSALVQLYSDFEGSTPIGNPISADTAGFVRFYVATGRYQITAIEGAFSRTWRDEVLGSYGGTIVYEQTAAETLAGTAPVDVSVPSHDKCGYFLPERYGFNTTPGTTSMQTALTRAIAAAAAAGGGTVLLSDRYKMTAPLAAAAKVDIVGTGQGASLEFPAGHGITIGWTTGFGSVTFDNFQVIGAGGGNYYGIYQAGTLDNADELYGLTIRRLLITDWNVGIKLRSTRNIVIEGNWIQDVDRGIELIGSCLVNHIAFNKIVHASGGGGAGSSIGMYFDSFNFTSGAGVVPPEGTQCVTNYVYGFGTGIYIGFVNVCNIAEHDIQASIYGVDFSTVQYEFTIRRCHFDLSGSGVLAGVYGRGLGGVPQAAKPTIEGCSLSCSGSASSVGVKINDSGNQYQSFVTVQNCVFDGFAVNDILFNNASGGWIIGNKCNSTTPTSSITVPNVVDGTVFIRDNVCAKLISYVAAEAAAGELVVGPNIYSSTSQLNYPGKWTTPTFSAGDYTANGSMTWTVGSGDVATYEYSIVGNQMTVVFSLDTTTVGGTPNTALRIAIPASKTAAKEAYNAILVLDNNVRSIGTAHVGAAGTVINIQLASGGNFAAATNTTYVKGQITFEIQ